MENQLNEKPDSDRMPVNPIEPVMLKSVVMLRPVRGNSATKHDRSPAQLEKNLRGQFGSFYDQKKIRNTQPQ